MLSLIQECQNHLVMLSNDQGYLTFEDILDAADSYHLSIVEVDKLSEAIQLLGILVYEEPPSVETNDEADDFSRVDYDSIYDEVESLSPDLTPLIEEIRRIMPPQYGEVLSLATQSAHGNAYARERLILSHLRVAIKTALSMTKHRHLYIDDAVSAACAGLIAGTDKYDPNGFSTYQGYVSMWIQQAIQRDCKPIWMEYYYPVHAREKIIPIYEEFLASDCGEDSYDEVLREISKKHGTDLSEVKSFVEAAIGQQQSKDDEESFERVFEIIDENAIDPCEHASQMLFNSDVNKALMTLKERERRVLMMRFGINEQQPMTLEEVGASFDLTRERIRQIETKAIKKLKRNKLLRSYA